MIDLADLYAHLPVTGPCLAYPCGSRPVGTHVVPRREGRDTCVPGAAWVAVDPRVRA